MNETCTGGILQNPIYMKKFFFSLLVILFFYCEQSDEGKHTNFIIILADDMGWSDPGFMGNLFYETPHLDQLAQQGMVFNRFYASAANCAPTRASLLTGMYAPRHGVYLPQGYARGGATEKMRFKVPTHGEDSAFLTFPVSINHVEPEVVSLAEMLKPAGYVSARLGKWHIGDDNQGFDLVSAAGVPGEITNIEGDEKRYYNDTTVARKLTDLALDFMEENREQPFFLYLSHWEVHTPLAAAESRVDYYRQKLKNNDFDFEYDPVYAGEVEQIDLSVGRVMQKLEELGLAENTVLIFTSDNGGVSDITNNAPLRAGKGTFYEGGIRTPMVIRWPQEVNAGTATDVPVNGIDFLPTFAAIAGVQPPAAQPLDGVSMVPLLQQKELPERDMFFHFPLYLGGGGKDKVMPSYQGDANYWRAVPSTTIISGDWKLIYYYEYENYELYNLAEDIGEENDLAEHLPEKAQEMVDKINRWTVATEAPVPEVLNNQK